MVFGDIILAWSMMFGLVYFAGRGVKSWREDRRELKRLRKEERERKRHERKTRYGGDVTPKPKLLPYIK